MDVRSMGKTGVSSVLWNSRKEQVEGGGRKQEGKILMNSEFRKAFHRSALSVSISEFV